MEKKKRAFSAIRREGRYRSIQHWQRQHSALAAAAFSIGSGSIQH
jgi:hypothetical protein